MTKKDFADIYAMCLNIIHGKDHWLYREVSKERAKKLVTSLIEEELHRDQKIVERFKSLQEDINAKEIQAKT